MSRIDPRSTHFAVVCCEMFCNGFSTMQIAEKLGVKEHVVYNVMARLGQ